MPDAINSPFTLRWRQQPQFRPLPEHIECILVPSPRGDLELLVSRPTYPDPEVPPIFFIHGGYGSAGVWLEWISYLHEAGYRGRLYAYSARNHGAIYSVPYLRMVYGTPFEEIIKDCMTCLAFAVKEQRANGHSDNVVLVGHSSGWGVAQYALAKGLTSCRALCLVDAIPHFGALPVYANWALHDPWFLLRSLFHLQHPTSPLSSRRLVHGVFFGDKFPMYWTKEFMLWMPAYDSILWPMSMMGDFMAWFKGSSRWLDVKSILSKVSGNHMDPNRDRVCIISGDQDVLMDLSMSRRQAAEYRQSMNDRRAPSNASALGDLEIKTSQTIEGITVETNRGVRLVVIEGADHHVQNDMQQNEGAEALLQFVQQC